MGGIFQGNPIEGEGFFTDTSGNVQLGNISDFFGGTYAVRNGSLINTTNGTILTTLGTYGGFYAEELDTGHILLGTEINPQSINSPLHSLAQRSISGTITVLDHQGNETELTLSGVNVNHIGSQTGMHRNADGDWVPFRLAGHYSSTAALRSEIAADWKGADPSAYRLANAEETASASLYYGLLRDQEQFLRDLANTGTVPDQGGANDFSNALRFIMQQMSLGDLTVHTNYILGGDGR